MDKKPLIVVCICAVVLFVDITILPFTEARTIMKSSDIEDLIIVVETDKTNYHIGEPVEISIFVKNHGNDDITIVFPNTKVADYSVDHYLWSVGKFFFQIILFFTISSGGQKLLFHDHWRQRSNDGTQVPPGTYGISGWMAQSLNYPAIYAELVYINIGTGNHPPNPPTIAGPIKGKIYVATDYNFTATDPDNDEVYYFIDWGDGTSTDWLGPYNSDESLTISHSWFKKGTYTIKARAKDTGNLWGPWGNLSVTMPLSYEPPQYPFLEWLLERFPNAFPILRYFLDTEYQLK